MTLKKMVKLISDTICLTCIPVLWVASKKDLSQRRPTNDTNGF